MNRRSNIKFRTVTIDVKLKVEVKIKLNDNADLKGKVRFELKVDVTIRFKLFWIDDYLLVQFKPFLFQVLIFSTITLIINSSKRLILILTAAMMPANQSNT